jgi:hypothetical protein
VFAIAITLLVLDIAVPAGASAHLLRSVAHLWPSYLACVVSFSTIGAIWLGHNAITEYLDRRGGLPGGGPLLHHPVPADHPAAQTAPAAAVAPGPPAVSLDRPCS